jgi:PhnB protein
VVRNASQFLSFVKEAFNAKVSVKFASADGNIDHCEVKMGDSMIMFGSASERVLPFPAMLHLYVEDADAVYHQALKAGAVSLREPENRPFGDRVSAVKDVWGNQWWIATHVENVSTEEIERRSRMAHQNKA